MLTPIGLDLDGVVVRPPLGWNIAISRRVNRPLFQPDEAGRNGDGHRAALAAMVHSWLERARYSFRRPMPDILMGVAELAKVREVHVVSARSHAGKDLTQRWLEAQGLMRHISDIHLKPAGVPSFHFKYETLRSLGAAEHVDDDGSTADYLARHGGIRVYLCDWPLNRGLAYPPSVRVVPGVTALARMLKEGEAAGSS